MTRQKLFALPGAALIAVVVLGIALAAGSATVGWQVIAGGGRPASAGNISINDTLGQPVSGISSSGDISLKAGYWPGIPVVVVIPEPSIFLPLVVR